MTKIVSLTKSQINLRAVKQEVKATAYLQRLLGAIFSEKREDIVERTKRKRMNLKI